jgi:hypothetical protein
MMLRLMSRKAKEIPDKRVLWPGWLFLATFEDDELKLALLALSRALAEELAMATSDPTNPG